VNNTFQARAPLRHFGGELPAVQAGRAIDDVGEQKIELRPPPIGRSPALRRRSPPNRVL